jgi:hypothetical protein
MEIDARDSAAYQAQRQANDLGLQQSASMRAPIQA